MTVSTDPLFADRLRQLREAASLSQYALAKQSGVSAQAISKIEKGEREPGWSTVRKLARALGVSVSAFDVEPPADTTEPADAVEPSQTPPISKRK